MKNEKSHLLDDYFNISVPVLLISEKERGEAFKKGWRSFYKTYPLARGIITLSRVGFNVRRTQALVYVTSGCSPLCGRGNFILLIKQNGVWTIDDEAMLWIS